jgi:hypothetical protein
MDALHVDNETVNLSKLSKTTGKSLYKLFSYSSEQSMRSNP